MAQSYPHRSHDLPVHNVGCHHTSYCDSLQLPSDDAAARKPCTRNSQPLTWAGSHLKWGLGDPMQGSMHPLLYT